MRSLVVSCYDMGGSAENIDDSEVSGLGSYDLIEWLDLNDPYVMRIEV